MLSNIKVIAFAVVSVAFIAAMFAISHMKDQLEVRMARIVFLEEKLKEESSAFKKLQDSCYLSQRLSEESANNTRQSIEEAEALKREIASIKESVGSRTNNVPTNDKTDKKDEVIGEVGHDKLNRKEGVEHATNVSLDGNLDPRIVRLLDAAYCNASPNDVYCNSE